ncbi:MAG: hypothetical protein ACXAEF_12430 [Candidatus Thorarchaeota archaeon]|jgi:hypothetical protein
MAEEPPSIEKFLPPDEEVEWAGKKRADFDYCCLVGIAFVVFIFVGGSLFYVIFEDPSQFLTFLPLQVIGSVFCIAVIYVRLKNVTWLPPWYFITNKRIIETRGTRIILEIDRGIFGDVSSSFSIKSGLFILRALNCSMTCKCVLHVRWRSVQNLGSV